MILPAHSAYRRGRLEIVNQNYVAFLAVGFALADYPGETLQCRTELDRTNWFELRDSCREAIAAERAAYEGAGAPLPDVLGDYPLPEPGIRCTSNGFIRPTVAATLTILADLKEWVRLAQENWWSLKDAVRDAETRQDLFALDLNAGWP